jgi:hypothetical protein
MYSGTTIHVIKSYSSFLSTVELYKAGHSDDPILIDSTRPLAGEVMDGDVLGQDLKYQSSDNEMCASWKGFYDPESGIEEYIFTTFYIKHLLLSIKSLL